MRQVKSKKKAYELAQINKLFYIENCRYSLANIGMVISMFENIKFYYKP